VSKNLRRKNRPSGRSIGLDAFLVEAATNAARQPAQDARGWVHGDLDELFLDAVDAVVRDALDAIGDDCLPRFGFFQRRVAIARAGRGADS
jgi:hypothetical protein